jgi:hypothetical protein
MPTFLPSMLSTSAVHSMVEHDWILPRYVISSCAVKAGPKNGSARCFLQAAYHMQVIVLSSLARADNKTACAVVESRHVLLKTTLHHYAST